MTDIKREVFLHSKCIIYTVVQYSKYIYFYFCLHTVLAAAVSKSLL